MKNNITNSRSVRCIERNKDYATGRDAAKDNGICASMVSRSCRLIRPTNGLNFRFLDENGNIIDTPSESKYKKNKHEVTTGVTEVCREYEQVVIHEESIVIAECGDHVNGNSKAVCCLETGEVRPSVKDMAKAHGVSPSYLSQCCNYGLTCNGMHYFFVRSASEYVDDIVSYIRSLQSKVNDPEYIAYKKEKEAEKAKAARKAELEQLISTCKENICELEVKTAHEYEMLEAFTAELDLLNAKVN